MGGDKTRISTLGTFFNFGSSSTERNRTAGTKIQLYFFIQRATAKRDATQNPTIAKPCSLAAITNKIIIKVIPSHERYTQVHQQVPFYFSLCSKFIEDDIFFIETNKIENICLSQYEPYHIESIKALFRIKTKIKALKIYIKNADLSRLKEISTIEILSIGEKSFNVDITGLANLKELYISNPSKLFGLDSLVNLQDLTLVKPSLEIFDSQYRHIYRRLISLTILGGKVPEKLEIFENENNLESLELFGIRNEMDFDLIAKKVRKLTCLKIEKCKCLKNLDKLLETAQNLKYLSFIDSVTLPNTKIISKLPNLKTLVVLGSSYFEDENLDELRKINWVSIDDKRHYNLKNCDLKKII